MHYSCHNDICHRPAQIIPTRPELDIEEDLSQNGARIEHAFTKYFHRDQRSCCNTSNQQFNREDTGMMNQNMRHEFDIIVCHGNVIRYMFCRALQLPPEAWLRLSIFNCSLTYLMLKPNGRVSCRMLGDIGHLGYDHSTFSMNHGFVW
jgi:serine/threonine-protein phosphatase PGAM5